MSLSINNTDMRQVEVNGDEKYRVEVNNTLVYAKRPISLDINLSSYTLPAGYHTTGTIPAGSYYFFWNDFVYTYENGKWIEHKNNDNTNSKPKQS